MVFTSMGQAIKNRDSYRWKYRSIYKADGDARECKEQQIIIYCLLLSCIWRKSYLSKRGKFWGGI